MYAIAHLIPSYANPPAGGLCPFGGTRQRGRLCRRWAERAVGLEPWHRPAGPAYGVMGIASRALGRHIQQHPAYGDEFRHMAGQAGARRPHVPRFLSGPPPMSCMSRMPKALPLAAYLVSLSLYVSLRPALRLAAMLRAEWDRAICVTTRLGTNSPGRPLPCAAAVRRTSGRHASAMF